LEHLHITNINNVLYPLSEDEGFYDNKIIIVKIIDAIENTNVIDYGWISVKDNPPQIQEGNVMSKTYLCVSKTEQQMVASLFPKADGTWQGFQTNGSSINDVTHYTELHKSPTS
jgi:hypothetical protein